jgi:hypothetical protein
VYDVAEMVRKMIAKLEKAGKQEGVTINNAELIDGLADLVEGIEPAAK